MADVWEFSAIYDDHPEEYADGTVVPHRRQKVILNGLAVGEVELHCHRRKGRDNKVDLSIGATFIAYGPLPGGK